MSVSPIIAFEGSDDISGGIQEMGIGVQPNMNTWGFVKRET